MADTSLVQTSTSQSVTYEAVGEKDDYSQIITNIDPEHNFYLSEFPQGKDATQLSFNWFTENLKPPQVNAHLEMEDYSSEKVGSLERRMNTCQFFRTTGRVSDAQRKTAKWYANQDEFTRQKEIAFEQHARDIEFALTTNAISRLESGDKPALMGGVPFFMQEESVTVTFDSAAGTVAASEAHKLSTGDFVYFLAAKGATLPTGIVANKDYYVLVKDDTTVQLFESMADAIAAGQKDATAEDTGKAITFSDAGTGTIKMLKNNVVDAGSKMFSEDHINDAMEMCYKRGGNPTLAVMSGRNKRRFSKLITGEATKRRDQKDKTVSAVTDTYISDFGTITAKVHRQYGDDRIDLMDLQYWEIKYFTRPHEVSGLPKKGSYDEFVLESCVGLQGTQPKASGAITNIKAV